jgi:hypothetical protein
VTNIFEGKTVIITGASAGVGRACAEAFADLKANLVLVARGEVDLKIAATELRAKTDVLTVAMDVADTKACIDLMAKAEAEFGRIDVLINNAGMHARGNVETKTPTDIAAMVDVNLRSPLVLSSAVIPYMRKVGGGAIVNVGSLAGRAPLQGALLQATLSPSRRPPAVAGIAGTGSQPYQVLVLDPFLNNQGAHARARALLGAFWIQIKKRRTDKKAPGEPPKIRTEIQM